MTHQAREALEPCPFCGGRPRAILGKKGHCQLHGDPFQPVIIQCKNGNCRIKPQVEGGDIFNGGEVRAHNEAAARWNTRAPTLAAQPDTVTLPVKWHPYEFLTHNEVLKVGEVVVGHVWLHPGNRQTWCAKSYDWQSLDHQTMEAAKSALLTKLKKEA